MCADAGEEELLLDALSVCGCALATLAAELAPEALLNAGLLPEEVSMDAAIAPYKLRLCISQVSMLANFSLPCMLKVAFKSHHASGTTGDWQS